MRRDFSSNFGVEEALEYSKLALNVPRSPNLRRHQSLCLKLCSTRNASARDDIVIRKQIEEIITIAELFRRHASYFLFQRSFYCWCGTLVVLAV